MKEVQWTKTATIRDKLLAPESDQEQLDGERSEMFTEMTLKMLAANVDIQYIVQEVLRQSTVLCWSALEVLANDLFITILNKRPSHVSILESDEDWKKLKIKAVDLSDLAKFNFNLSNRLGTLVSEKISIDSVLKLKAIYKALFPKEAAMREKLHEDDLWKLNQTRNLIVHRRGIVDEHYLKQTGATLPLGTPIALRVADFQRSFTVTFDAGLAILQAASELLQQPLPQLESNNSEL